VLDCESGLCVKTFISLATI